MVSSNDSIASRVGRDIIARGGNAVDAAVAAGFASWVTESPLTGPGGGGFMLVHRARDRTTRLLDFFVTVPSGGADPGAMDAVDISFDGNFPMRDGGGFPMRDGGGFPMPDTGATGADGGGD